MYVMYQGKYLVISVRGCDHFLNCFDRMHDIVDNFNNRFTEYKDKLFGMNVSIIYCKVKFSTQGWWCEKSSRKRNGNKQYVAT